MAVPVKLTRAHQVTLPTRLLKQAGWLSQEYFVADLQQGALILKPMAVTSQPLASLADLRRRFAQLGITQCDVSDAVDWTRRQTRSGGRRRRAKR